MRLPLAVVLLSLLAGCATAPGQTGRPSTLSDLVLALDASERMGGDPRCGHRSVSGTEVLIPVELAAQGVSGRWTERWTVDRCGMLVPYVVKFDRAPDGDLDVSMQREVPEGEAAAIPGETRIAPCSATRSRSLRSGTCPRPVRRRAVGPGRSSGRRCWRPWRAARSKATGPSPGSGWSDGRSTGAGRPSAT